MVLEVYLLVDLDTVAGAAGEGLVARAGHVALALREGGRQAGALEAIAALSRSNVSAIVVRLDSHGTTSHAKKKCARNRNKRAPKARKIATSCNLTGLKECEKLTMHSFEYSTAAILKPMESQWRMQVKGALFSSS